MAEAVRRSRLVFLNLTAKIFTSVLAFLGVLSGSGCINGDMPTYGPPAGVYFQGQVLAFEDSSSVNGVQVQLSNPDLSSVYGTTQSNPDGKYYLYLEQDSPPWPDTVLVSATDVDGEANGSFAPKDTLIFPDSDEEYQEFQIDFLLDKE
ncbi:MAG: hypothetical protein KAS73_07565 [Candidatus Sabulitectum sp.]|nr:hypothetical protein [Candidatus Sabulitectum sp.]